MTEAQARWLRKLRDEGDQQMIRAPDFLPDWTENYFGGSTKRRRWMERITPAGLAALAAHEQGEGDESP